MLTVCTWANAEELENVAVFSASVPLCFASFFFFLQKERVLLLGSGKSVLRQAGREGFPWLGVGILKKKKKRKTKREEKRGEERRGEKEHKGRQAGRQAGRRNKRGCYADRQWRNQAEVRSESSARGAETQLCVSVWGHTDGGQTLRSLLCCGIFQFPPFFLFFFFFFLCSFGRRREFQECQRLLVGKCLSVCLARECQVFPRKRVWLREGKPAAGSDSLRKCRLSFGALLPANRYWESSSLCWSVCVSFLAAGFSAASHCLFISLSFSSFSLSLYVIT